MNLTRRALTRIQVVTVVGVVFLLGGCASAPLDEPNDPLEPANRAMFTFNRNADKYLLKPVAKGYQKITPVSVQRGVSNIFDNLNEPRTVANDLLQFKLVQASSDTGRFLLNSTAGFAGVMDVATDAGMPRHSEDFGQTLGTLGVGEGWYLMIPFLGPSTNRDLLGRLVDTPLQIASYLSADSSLPLKLFDILDLRTKLLEGETLLENALDPYVFVRTAYLQSRLTQVYDGNPPARLIYGEGE